MANISSNHKLLRIGSGIISYVAVFIKEETKASRNPITQLKKE